MTCCAPHPRTHRLPIAAPSARSNLLGHTTS